MFEEKVRRFLEIVVGVMCALLGIHGGHTRTGWIAFTGELGSLARRLKIKLASPLSRSRPPYE